MKKKIRKIMICIWALVFLLFGVGLLIDRNSTPDTETASSLMDTDTSQWPLNYVPENPGKSVYLKMNQQNQVQNSGTFLVQNGWIYGQSFDAKGNSLFVKVRSDDTDWTVLDTGFVTKIDIVDNYIYYMKQGSDYGIYRMKTSGDGKQLLVKAYGSMQIVDKVIYYSDYMVNGVYDESNGDVSRYHLFRCNLDGSNVTEIIKKPAFYAFAFEDKFCIKIVPIILLCICVIWMAVKI